MHCKPSVNGITIWLLLSLVRLGMMLLAVDTQISDNNLYQIMICFFVLKSGF